MTARRSHGNVVFDCDGDGCPAEFDTDMQDFTLARELLRDEGWLTVRRGKEWRHYCEDCQDDY